MKRLWTDLVEIYKQFGLLGVVTYMGGGYMLYLFPKQTDHYEQLLYVATGLTLVVLATLIYNIRVKAQREREKLIVEMSMGSCNRLAEQLAKGLDTKQIEGITQKIRQINSDTSKQVFGQEIIK